MSHVEDGPEVFTYALRPEGAPDSPITLRFPEGHGDPGLVTGSMVTLQVCSVSAFASPPIHAVSHMPGS